MTLSDPTAHSSPLFYDLKILKFDDLHQLPIFVFVYECQNNIASLYFVNFFTQTANVKLLQHQKLVETFYLAKKALCGMAYVPSVSMEQDLE